MPCKMQIKMTMKLSNALVQETTAPRPTVNASLMELVASQELAHALAARTTKTWKDSQRHCSDAMNLDKTD